MTISAQTRSSRAWRAVRRSVPSIRRSCRRPATHIASSACVEGLPPTTTIRRTPPPVAAGTIVSTACALSEPLHTSQPAREYAGTGRRPSRPAASTQERFAQLTINRLRSARRAFSSLLSAMRCFPGREKAASCRYLSPRRATLRGRNPRSARNSSMSRSRTAHHARPASPDEVDRPRVSSPPPRHPSPATARRPVEDAAGSASVSAGRDLPPSVSIQALGVVRLHLTRVALAR